MSAMSTFGCAAAADTISNENHNGEETDDDIFVERREIFEAYAYTTFGTLAARRIVEDVQDIRDERIGLSCFSILVLRNSFPLCGYTIEF